MNYYYSILRVQILKIIFLIVDETSDDIVSLTYCLFIHLLLKIKHAGTKHLILKKKSKKMILIIDNTTDSLY